MEGILGELGPSLQHEESKANLAPVGKVMGLWLDIYVWCICIYVLRNKPNGVECCLV